MRHESYSTTLPVLFLFLPQFTERIHYYLEKNSRQLDIDSLQNQKYMSVQQFNELPQFLLQEVGFEHIDDNGIITI